MIAYLRGKILFVHDNALVLDVGGVGYKVFTEPNTLNALVPDSEAEFFIHTAVREDSINLYGFKNRETFELFELLLTVSGIGAKGALAIVSKISANDFYNAVATQDLKAITKLPGVGKKSAERILLELKDKVKPINISQPAQIHLSATDDAVEALSALGYTAAEISEVFKNAPPNSTTEQLIKFALKNLNSFG